MLRQPPQWPRGGSGGRGGPTDRVHSTGAELTAPRWLRGLRRRRSSRETCSPAVRTQSLTSPAPFLSPLIDSQSVNGWKLSDRRNSASGPDPGTARHPHLEDPLRCSRFQGQHSGRPDLVGERWPVALPITVHCQGGQCQTSNTCVSPKTKVSECDISSYSLFPWRKLVFRGFLFSSLTSRVVLSRWPIPLARLLRLQPRLQEPAEETEVSRTEQPFRGTGPRRVPHSPRAAQGAGGPQTLRRPGWKLHAQKRAE